MKMKPLVRSLRLGLQRIILISLVGAVLTVTSDQRAVGQTGNGWVDDGPVVRLENLTDQVGIGTTRPSRKLEVVEDIDAAVSMGVRNPNAGSRATALLAVNSDGTQGSFYAHSSSFVSPHRADRVALIAESNASGVDVVSTNTSGDLRVFTSGYRTGNERMRITPSGDIGIGTASPGRKLHVVENAPNDANGGQLEITGTAITTAGITSKSLLLGRAFQYGFVQSQNSDPLVLNPIGNNVGIGTTTPGEKLDVRGGAAKITNGGNGAVLLDLNSERNWQFRQLGTGAGTALELASVGGGGNKQFVLNTTGNIGIGTTNPREKLHVAGNFLRVDGAGNEQVYIGGDGAGNDVQLGSLNGNVTNVALWNAATGTRMRLIASVLEITGGTDLAEPFDISGAETIQPGMVVAIDPERPGSLRLAGRAYDRTVAGIVSGANGIKPGVTMKQEGTVADGSLPVSLTGRVYCYADASYDPIEPGDLLTTSDTLGHAMKVTDYAKAQGAIIGKAMTSLKKGKGLVLVLVALQ